MKYRKDKIAIEIADCARKAALSAAISYYEMSGGNSVHEAAIETFVSSKIAESIFQVTESNVLLESTFATIHQLSGAERRGRSVDHLPAKARFDVSVFKDKKPIGVIEVKKRFAPFKAEKDAVRLSQAVRRYGPEFGGSVRFGLWIALQRVWETQRKDIAKRISSFRESLGGIIASDIEFEEKEGEFGVAKNGKNVVGLVAYSVLFEPAEGLTGRNT
jgi:hypothetical protein